MSSSYILGFTSDSQTVLEYSQCISLSGLLVWLRYKVRTGGVFECFYNKEAGCQVKHVGLLCLLLASETVGLKIHKHSQSIIDFISSEPYYNSIKI